MTRGERELLDGTPLPRGKVGSEPNPCGRCGEWTRSRNIRHFGWCMAFDMISHEEDECEDVLAGMA